MTFLSKIIGLIWAGLWTGFGFECSFFVLWVVWKVAHSRVAHRLESSHWFHELSEYFK